MNQCHYAVCVCERPAFPVIEVLLRGDSPPARDAASESVQGQCHVSMPQQVCLVFCVWVCLVYFVSISHPSLCIGGKSRLLGVSLLRGVVCVSCVSEWVNA